MFLRYFIFISIFLSFANSFDITKNQDIYNFNDFKLYEDKTSTKNLSYFLENKQVFKTTKKTNIGIKKHNIWSYGKIINKTSTSKELIFTNPRAGIDFLNVYIFKNNKLVKEHILGDMNPQNKRELLYRKSSFRLYLQTNQEYEIFVKYKSFGAIDINLIAQNENQFVEEVSKESTFFGFIAGFVFLILIFLVYINIYFPSKVNKIYFVILFGTIAIQFSVSGVFYQMGINPYINTIISWSLGNLAAALIGLFPLYYFNLKKLMPKTSILLYILSSLIFLLSFVFLFYPLKNELLYLAPYANFTFFAISSVLIYVSINLYFNKIEGYTLYLLGNTLFIISVLYFILGLLGIVPTNNLFYLSLGIGSFLNILCLGLLITANLIKIKKDKDNAMIVLNEYSKLSTVGQSMINLSHQWKEPLNHIYYAINNITAAKEFKDPNLPKIIDDSLDQIKNTATYMTNTGKNFLSIYSDKNYKENINLSAVINSVLILFKKPIDELDIQLDLNLQNITLVSNKYLLSNIFMAIIENSIKMFKNRKINNPKLSINIKKIDSSIIIEMHDNAKGIKQTPINSIFEKDFTDSKSTGLGLYLVKNILTLKLNGSIEAKNQDNGVFFKIILPI